MLHISNITNIIYYILTSYRFGLGARGGVVVKELRYKPAGRGLVHDGVIGMFQLHNSSGGTMALESTQPLTEMSTRNISCG
jgi:hypothetical protein